MIVVVVVVVIGVVAPIEIGVGIVVQTSDGLRYPLSKHINSKMNPEKGTNSPHIPGTVNHLTRLAGAVC